MLIVDTEKLKKVKIRTIEKSVFYGYSLPDGSLKLHQKRYIEKSLNSLNLTEIKPSLIPADPNVKLSDSMSPKDESEKSEMKDTPYRTAIGSLLYAAINARPDISFATNQASLFVENPGKEHWNAVLQIFGYLRKNADLGIIFAMPPEPPTGFTIHAYCDASYANNQKCRSTTGYIIYLNGSPVAWRTKVQNVVALSSTEAEYMALSDCSKEIMWLKQLLNELNIKPIDECIIFEDNQGAIKLTENAVLHQKTKHIDIRYHYIRELLTRKEFQVIYVSTTEQDGDSFTKAKPFPAFSSSRAKYMF